MSIEIIGMVGTKEVSVRPIVADTEEAAWQRAGDIRSATARRVADAETAQVQGVQVPARGGRLFGFRESSSVGSGRLQRQATERDVHDQRHAAQARQEPWPAALYAEVIAESASRRVLINTLRVEPELGTPARGGLPAAIARRGADGRRETKST